MAEPAQNTAPAEPNPAPAAAREPDPERPLSRRGWIIVGLMVLLANVALIHRALRGPAPATVQGPSFADDFNRVALGDNYFTTGMHWRIVGGELLGPDAHNNPLWLQMKLPRDVAIEFDARSETGVGSRPGDIKFEIFGNGRDAASGYVCIFGGWGNTISVIARLDEHGESCGNVRAGAPCRVERRDKRVEIKRTYHMRVERKGARLSWFIDGDLFMSLDDPQPLEGAQNDRFGFSGWEAELVFDNLKVEPL